MRALLLGAVVMVVATCASAGAQEDVSESAVCADLSTVVRQFQIDTVEYSERLSILRMTPGQDYAKYFDGAELDAAIALADSYGAIMPMLEYFERRLATFASLMETCAKPE